MDKNTTCNECENFLGGGDWNLCCKNPPEDQLSMTWCGHLCYEDTPTCKNFIRKAANTIETQNTQVGKLGSSLSDIIQLRGIKKPNASRQGLPTHNYWWAYYEGWKAAYRDLKEILEQHYPELLKEIIIPLE